MAVTVENALLPVAGVMTESFELQSCFQVSEQVDVAALNINAIDLQNLCKPRQTIDGGCREDNAALQNGLQQLVKNSR